LNINLLPFLYLWLALDVVIIVLFGFRQKIARTEDASTSLSVTDPVAASQVKTLGTKLDKIEKWIKLLVIIAVIFGVVLGVLAIVQAFNSPSAAVGA
jgi:hypothetical protein